MDTTGWKWFRLDTIFRIDAGHYYYPSEYSDGETPYCSASAENNGIGKLIDVEPDFDGNQIIIGKIKCPTFYQNSPFCATSDVNVLTPKFKMTPYIALFIATIINRSEGYKWNYGRQCRVNDTKQIKIKLPANSQGEPDFEWMDCYIKNDIIPKLPSRAKLVWGGQFNKSRIVNILFQLDVHQWQTFIFSDIFEVKKGKRLTKAEMITGNIPYIGAVASNNGRTAFISNDKWLHSKNTISVSYNGSIAEAFYQDSIFWATDDVNVLYPKFIMNKYIAFFIITLIRREKYRFNYGRKWDKELMQQSSIKLPTDSDGNPDWQFMENYIKSLPYSANV